MNTIAEEAISSMATVKSVAGERTMQTEFDHRVMGYFHLQRTESAAYSVYALITSLLPSVVNGLVLLYGGHLVLSKEMSGGDLVSFMYAHAAGCAPLVRRDERKYLVGSPLPGRWKRPCLQTAHT